MISAPTQTFNGIFTKFHWNNPLEGPSFLDDSSGAVAARIVEEDSHAGLRCLNRSELEKQSIGEANRSIAQANFMAAASNVNHNTGGPGWVSYVLGK